MSLNYYFSAEGQKELKEQRERLEKNLRALAKVKDVATGSHTCDFAMPYDPLHADSLTIYLDNDYILSSVKYGSYVNGISAIEIELYVPETIKDSSKHPYYVAEIKKETPHSNIFFVYKTKTGIDSKTQITHKMFIEKIADIIGPEVMQFLYARHDILNPEALALTSIVKNNMPHQILLTLDLDFSLFDSLKTFKNTSQHVPVSQKWFKSPEYWKKLLQSHIDDAQKENIDVFFGIVTTKKFFDGICKEAAKELKEFISRNAKVNMFTKGEEGYHCLVQQTPNNPEVVYRLVKENISDYYKQKISSFSHFILLNDGTNNKSTPILNLANQYGIPATQCIHVDDHPTALNDVASHNIQTVSLECFHQYATKPRNELDELESAGYIDEQMNLFEKALKYKFTEVIQGIKATAVISNLSNLSLQVEAYECKEQSNGIYTSYGQKQSPVTNDETNHNNSNRHAIALK